jgi:hypothetical protein
MIEIPGVQDMDDETLIKHMELRHNEDVAMNFTEEPERKAKGLSRRLRGGVVWRTFHNYLHQLYDGREVDGEPFFNHQHKQG